MPTEAQSNRWSGAVGTTGEILHHEEYWDEHASVSWIRHNVSPHPSSAYAASADSARTTGDSPSAVPASSSEPILSWTRPLDSSTSNTRAKKLQGEGWLELDRMIASSDMMGKGSEL
jgi:hypothetical protein